MALTLFGDGCRPEASMTCPRYSTEGTANVHFGFCSVSPAL